MKNVVQTANGYMDSSTMQEVTAAPRSTIVPAYQDPAMANQIYDGGDTGGQTDDNNDFLKSGAFYAICGGSALILLGVMAYCFCYRTRKTPRGSVQQEGEAYTRLDK